MGAVDRSNMMISSIVCVRKSLRWYKKLFLRFLDITLLLQTTYNGKACRNIALADFQLTPMGEILKKNTTKQDHLQKGHSSVVTNHSDLLKDTSHH